MDAARRSLVACNPFRLWQLYTQLANTADARAFPCVAVTNAPLHVVQRLRVYTVHLSAALGFLRSVFSSVKNKKLVVCIA